MKVRPCFGSKRSNDLKIFVPGMDLFDEATGTSPVSLEILIEISAFGASNERLDAFSIYKKFIFTSGIKEDSLG